ncbi:Helitron helicase [Phytophthora megakarya]|uniref:Helitron helicase n=1 Tax=Phytophthora megakarya TaxID=4795 RepID=A0A225UGH6_9STRA|nr:Helitron helicase [Phytophthora megakarya]
MLIRNLNTKEGLCNGIRLRIAQLRPNSMESALMSGAFAGIKNSAFPFELQRKYFRYRFHLR